MLGGILSVNKNTASIPSVFGALPTAVTSPAAFAAPDGFNALLKSTGGES